MKRLRLRNRKRLGLRLKVGTGVVTHRVTPEVNPLTPSINVRMIDHKHIVQITVAWPCIRDAENVRVGTKGVVYWNNQLNRRGHIDGSVIFIPTSYPKLKLRN
jgi:hypothetical protein